MYFLKLWTSSRWPWKGGEDSCEKNPYLENKMKYKSYFEKGLKILEKKGT